MGLTFKDFKYERPEYETVKQAYEKHLAELKKAETTDQFFAEFMELNKVKNHVYTMNELVNIRDSINKNDPFYSEELKYWDEYSPLYEELNNRLYRVMVNTPLKEQIAGILPKTYYPLIENSLKSFSSEIIGDLQEENRLCGEYSRLIANSKIQFNGQTYNIEGIKALTLSPDRLMRKAAFDAMIGYYAAQESEFDRIYDELVKVRTKMARSLGFSSFVEMGYLRRDRLDYNQEDVKTYREEVVKHIVPVAEKLYARQRERLHLDTLAYYDEKFEFVSGNATPKGTPEELVKAAQDMYHAMGTETGEFFDLMREQELMDLVSKPGKAGGGYCVYLPEDLRVPFIFANFNGTSHDVDVLTHEAGHALQMYLSNYIDVMECSSPTYESCEIHSMSMEFFAWPWMESFFGEDTDKYYFSHLSSGVKFVPYGVLVDHFQHEVYKHPEMTPDERKRCYRELEKQYLPHKNYQGCELLEKGCWWYQQAHIFEVPFYYIDYTLAQVCAFQYWKRMQDQDASAWQDYLSICEVGGALSFLEIVKLGGLESPFEKGCMETVMERIDEYLGGIDDKRL